MTHTPLRAGTKRLIGADKTVALFGCFGDVPVNAALPIIKEKRIALVGAVTGAEAHRNNLIFFSCAPATRCGLKKSSREEQHKA